MALLILGLLTDTTLTPRSGPGAWVKGTLAGRALRGQYEGGNPLLELAAGPPQRYRGPGAGGETGKRGGLKIRWATGPLWVRSPPRPPARQPLAKNTR